MSALRLFDPSAAEVVTDTPGAHHRDDRPTAVAAALSVRSGTQRAQVLVALARAGDFGLTGHDACLNTECAYPHSATTRIEELVRLGLAEPTERTRPTPTGRQATVWMATEAGRKMARELAS